MTLARMKVEGLGLLSQFFLIGMSACLSDFTDTLTSLTSLSPYSTSSRGGLSSITATTQTVRRGAFLPRYPSKAWGVGVQL